MVVTSKTFRFAMTDSQFQRLTLAYLSACQKAGVTDLIKPGQSSRLRAYLKDRWQRQLSEWNATVVPKQERKFDVDQRKAQVTIAWRALGHLANAGCRPNRHQSAGPTDQSGPLGPLSRQHQQQGRLLWRALVPNRSVA